MKPALFGFLFCAALAAQPANLEGTVVNQTNGQPIAGVHIRMITGAFGDSDGDQTVYGSISDRAGHFSVNGMKAGLYILAIERAGFTEAPAAKPKAPFNMVALKPGQHLADYKIEMTPRATVSGRVVDEYGDPVTHISVDLEPLPGSNLSFSPFGGPRSGSTDDRGEFHLVTGPGRFYVRVATFMRQMDGAEIRTDGSSGAPFIQTYYPSAANTSSASLLQAAPGQDLAGLEIRLLRGATVPGSSGTLSISGVVNGLPENPQMVQVTLLQGESPDVMYNSNSTNVTNDGKFHFGRLQAGLYRVVARYSSGKTHVRSQPVDTTLGSADETNVQLTLAPGEELTGTLTIAGGAAPEAATPKRTVRLEAVGSMNQFGDDPPGSGDVGAGGAFRITNVLPGKFRPVVEPLPEDGYIESVKLDNMPIADSLLDFTHGVQSAHLKITINRNGAEVSGTVLDAEGKPLLTPMVMIYLVTEPKQMQEMQEDDLHRVTEGKFTIKAVRPGKYRLIAIDALGLFASGDVDMDSDNNDQMKKLFDAAEEIEIKAGDRVVKDVKAIDKMPGKEPRAEQ